MDTFEGVRAPLSGQAWPALHPKTAQEAVDAALAAATMSLEKTQRIVHSLTQALQQSDAQAVAASFEAFEKQLAEAEHAAGVYDRLHTHLLDSLYAYDCLPPDVAHATSKWRVCSAKIRSALATFAQLQSGGSARCAIERTMG